MDFTANSKEPLEIIQDSTRIFLGRKKSLHNEYGDEGILLIGRSVEKENVGKEVYLDAISPHVIFACGSRGTGKSYSISVIAEELVTKNPNVASVMIDPIGIFWSMKYPNKDDKELMKLAEWGLEPKGIKNIQVFIPKGLKSKIPPGTYDRLFAIKPAELSVDDWCITFGLERFGTTALLFEKTIEKARGKFGTAYSIDDLINVANKDSELTDKIRGYKADTRRALTSRLEAAKAWGILDKDATDLSEICKEGFVSVIDISFLEESVASLVIGILAKKILNARKLMTRKSSMEEYVSEDLDDLLNTEIPPTWLFIDEAHTLIPSGLQKTAATDALIEYVKQGRRPGCSLVFATQQPSAIDTRVLSQLDVVLCHKLVFDEDLKAVMKRMPTVVPPEYENSKFLKTLPIGIALVGDRSDTTSRAFCLQIRPRLSQHEGRESHSVELDKKKVDPEKLIEMITELVYKKIQQTGAMKLYRIEETTDTIGRKYDLKLDTDRVIQNLLNKGCKQDDEKVFLEKNIIPEVAEEKAEEPKEKNILELKEIDIKKIAEQNRQKKFLFLGKEEKITDISLKYEQMYKINFDAVLPNGFRPANIFVDQNYEIYYFTNGLKKTKDVAEVLNMTQNEVSALNAVEKTKDIEKLRKLTGMTAQGLARTLRSLADKGYVLESDTGWNLKKRLSIPDSIVTQDFKIQDKLKMGAMKQGAVKERPSADEEVLKKIPRLFEKAKVKNIEVFWKPVYYVTYDNGQDQRILKVDAIS